MHLKQRITFTHPLNEPLCALALLLVLVISVPSGSKQDEQRLEQQGEVSSGILSLSSPHRLGHAVREFLSLASADGFRPTSIEQGRQILLRFERFLRDQLQTGLEQAGWREYAAFKAQLAQIGVSRATIRCYLSYLTSFYRLRAQASQDPELLDIYTKVKALGSVRKASSRGWEPLELAMVRRLLETAEGEDRVFLMTLLYTGGRAQFYGLQVGEVDLARGEIHAVVKGGKRATTPLHPALASVLSDHLATRGYDSPFLFLQGKDVDTRRGQRANRQNAWRICKRVQRAAGIGESVHPHRFRKTLATWGKRAGLDPQFLQAILAHESVNLTLDAYAQVEMEDVKRAFAEFDPLKASSGSEEQGARAGETLMGLRAAGPAGKEQAWQSLLEGLEGLLRESLPSSETPG